MTNHGKRAGGRPRVALAAATLGAVVTLVLGVAGPALASPAGWYGYAVTGSTYKTVSADWTVPTPKCTSKSALTTIWIGLDGYSSPTSEQVGVDINCTSGKAVFKAYYQFFPKSPVIISRPADPVKAGDAIQVSVGYLGSNHFLVQFHDTTEKWGSGTSATAAATDRSSAEAIVDDPGGLTWSPVKFTGVTVDGTALGSLKPVKITGGSKAITVSPVHGESFTVSS
jgi:hypothetical protein